MQMHYLYIGANTDYRNRAMNRIATTPVLTDINSVI